MDKGEAIKPKEIKRFQCLHTGCKAYVTSPSPKAKYCKKHRQVVYKKNYLNRNLKLRAKYQASRTCFSGSSDPFDGQDLDDMLHQVLAQKRLALMQSPCIIEFLQLRQNEIKMQNQGHAAEELRKHNLQNSISNFNSNSGILFARGDDQTAADSNDSTSFNDECINANSEDNDLLMMPQSSESKSTDLNIIVRSPVNVSSNISLQNSSCLNKVKCLGKQLNEVTYADNNNNNNNCNNNNMLWNATAPNLLKITPSIAPPINMSQAQLDRRSAFQVTGAGDANSLLAVRAAVSQRH